MPESESSPLDSEDWNIVFRAYEEYPILAVILAQHLDYVKVLIERGPEGRKAAIAGLDQAIESLYPLTIFRDAGQKIYLLAVRGELQPEHQEIIRELDLLS